MLQKIKFFLLALCAIFCFSAVSACSDLPAGGFGSGLGGSSIESGLSDSSLGGESNQSDSSENKQPEPPPCAHSWEEGYCPLCQTYCPHDFGYNDPTCYICGLTCYHQFEQGECVYCYADCMHSWCEGVCGNCQTICNHDYDLNGYCTTCSKQCCHLYYENGVCMECNFSCMHQNGYTEGVCNTCFKTCEHSFDINGWCYLCSSPCRHEYANGQNTCLICYYYCSEHAYTDGWCYLCQHECPHNYETGNAACLNCSKLCVHKTYVSGVCEACGVACPHTKYTDGVCDKCATVCPHQSYSNGICSTCEYVCPHDFDNGVCGDCGLEFALTYLLANTGDYYTVTGANDKNVSAISIPATYENKPVKKINKEAFKNYANLTTVTLAEGLEEIGEKAFYGCSKLSSCNIPSTVTTIGADIMENVTALTYENDVYYLGAWVIGYDSRVTTPISVKAGTIGIADNAFADGGQQTKLSAISLPTSLQYIGKNAFYHCSALEEIVIPDGVKILQAWTFSGCASLSDVTLSSTLTTIYPYAFENCTSLAEIDIPSTVSLVDKTSFNGCSALIQTVNNVNYVDTWAIGATSKNVTSLAFRQGTLGIAQNAFQDYTSVVSVDFSGIQHIGYMAFAYCSSLEQIILPDSVLTVGSYAFHNCNKAQTISIGKGVKRIEEYTFAKSGSSLVDVKLSIANTIEYLGENAFYWTRMQNPNEISFDGTAEEWLAIEKENDWCSYFQVHCLQDGKYLNNNGVEY